MSTLSELNRVVESRKRRQVSADVGKGKPKSIINTNAMGADSGEKAQSS